jgi:hypothetical protein
MQNPYAHVNAALADLNAGLSELLIEFGADREARRKSCPPPAVQDAALTVTAPAVSVQGVGSALCPSAAVSGDPAPVCASVGPMESGGTRRSNLDLNGRLVKRGLTISFHGLRYLVSKTNRGYCYCKVVSVSGRVHVNTLLVMYPCESVQVVAPISRKAAPPVSRVGAKGAALPLCN